MKMQKMWLKFSLQCMKIVNEEVAESMQKTNHNGGNVLDNTSITGKTSLRYAHFSHLTVVINKRHPSFSVLPLTCVISCGPAL